MRILPESVFRPTLHGQFFFSLLCVCLAFATTSDEGKSCSLADHLATIPPSNSLEQTNHIRGSHEQNSVFGFQDVLLVMECCKSCAGGYSPHQQHWSDP